MVGCMYCIKYLLGCEWTSEALLSMTRKASYEELFDIILKQQEVIGELERSNDLLRGMVDELLEKQVQRADLEHERTILESR